MNTTKWLVILVVLLGMYASFIDNYVPLPMGVRWLDIVLAAWICLLLLQGVRLPRPGETRGVYGALILFVFVTLVVTLFGVYGGTYSTSQVIDGVSPSVRTVLYCATFLLAYNAIVRKAVTLSFVVKTLLYGVLPHFGYAVLQFIALNMGTINYDSLPFQPGRIRASGEYELVTHSATGFTEAPFSLAAYGGLVAILSFALLLHGKSAERRFTDFKLPPALLLWVGYLTGMGMIVMSYRRTALIAAVAAMLGMALLKLLFASQPGRRTKGLSVLVLSIVLIAGSVTWMASNSLALQNRLNSLVSLANGNLDDPQLRNLEGRSNTTWGYWIDNFQDYPMGVGFYAPAVFNIGSDNSYLTYLAQGGLIYAGVYILLLAFIFLLGFRYMRHRRLEMSAYGMALCGLLLYIGISGLGTGGSMASQLWVMRWLFVGAFLGLAKLSLAEDERFKEETTEAKHPPAKPVRRAARPAANLNLVKRGDVL